MSAMRMMNAARAIGRVAALIAVFGAGAPAGAADQLVNDYPTATRADYVFGCMQVNGQTPLALERCACSIDVIATVLPYKEYEEAETILSVRQRGGESVAPMFHHTARDKVNNLKRAQVEGELRCF